MDVISRVRSYLGSWSKGGEAECRQYLFTPHCNVSDTSSADILTTAYHTILCSALQTFSKPPTLAPMAVVEFIQAVLQTLPSSSSREPRAGCILAAFGEIIVDMIWSIDGELEETIAECKNTQAAVGLEGSALKSDEQGMFAEKDKEVVQQIVRWLVELRLIDPALCRERLDSSTLAGVGLIQDKTILEKKEIRTRTGLFYKQNKFNLLREQSEGYSKLITELSSNLGPSHSPSTGRPTESPLVIECRARPVWEKIISLVGYFDLDPNRALDLILDAFSVHIVTHYSFFLTLLSFSPWAGTYKPRLEAEMNVDPPAGTYRGKSFDEVLSLAAGDSPEKTHSLGTNSHVLAQVLGFKFSHYQNQEVPEAVPKNLYTMTATLIREGFINLEDIYPHLSPVDGEMGNLQKEYREEVKSRSDAAKISQLAMAAPLESSGPASNSKKTNPSTPAPETKKVPPLKDTNQKAGLLIGLLAVGALEPAIAILTKFPWLVDTHPEVADLLINILKHSTARLYQNAVMPKDQNKGFLQPRARYGMTGVIPAPVKKPTLTLCAPAPPITSTTEFVFFFPDWVKRIPVCTNFDDLQDVAEPILKFIGIHLYRDPQLIVRLVRLGKHHIQFAVPELSNQTNSESIDLEHPSVALWLKILRVYVLPALSLVRGSAVCQVEIWYLLKCYDLTTRWRLYGEWRAVTYSSHPELQIRRIQADRESKGILRRLSHQTANSLAGQAAKLAHSNPCIYFSIAVNQVMAYDNLAQVVILGLRHSTHMDLDVLVFVLLDALANPKKDRLKDDGVNTADWLQSLASFTGILYRRFQMTLTPLLTYIVNQLYNDQTTDLLVLQQLIWNMAGIEPLPTLSEDQIICMSGGPRLRTEALASKTRGAQADINDNSLMQATVRLGRSLLESGLALPLLIQVAQLRQSCIFRPGNQHLKSLGNLFDTTHGVLLQYLELLGSSSAISLDDYATKILPSIGELGKVYGISAPICMQIIRPVLHHTWMRSVYEKEKQDKLEEEEKKKRLKAASEENEKRLQATSEETEKRLKAALTAKRDPASSRVASPSMTTAAAESGDVKAQTDNPSGEKDVVMAGVDQSTQSTPPMPESPWLPELVALFDDVKRIAPGNSYEVLGPGFYTTFWQLSTYDLSVPFAKYEQQNKALLALNKQADKDYIEADRSSDRSRRAGAQGHRHRRDHYNKVATELMQELKEHTMARQQVIKRLSREKVHWFAHSPKALSLVNAIIEHCLLPRCVLSPMDADFCSQFIKVLHTQGTPGFHTLMCYDRLLGDHVKALLFSCSEYEAHNFGRFLLGVLTDLSKWRKDQAAYLADNRIKMNSRFIYHPGMQKSWSTKPATLDTILSWEDFQKVLRKWHRKLAKCFSDCLQTGEFMHVYNTIIILKELLPVFPQASVSLVGPEIDTAVDHLLENETRGDLKTLAKAYSANLKQKKADWAPKPKSQMPQPSSAAKPTERPRSTGAPPTGPSAQSEMRRPVGAPSTPSAPRAQLAGSNSERQLSNGVTSAKISMESIPRPEVIKRIRPNSKSQSPKPPEDSSNLLPDAYRPPLPHQVTELRKEEPHRPASPASGRDSPLPQAVGSGTAREAPSSPRIRSNEPRLETMANMPPPSVPSQTLSAQELRETAKLTISRNERPEGAGRSGGGSGAPSPLIRSPSPTSSRPGTRNASADSRHSGGRSRSDRDPERPDDRRPDRDRTDSREDPRAPSRRDSLTHNRDRRERTRDSDKDDRDRGRDRHGDKERDRDTHPERARDRERDRERERERDRHRRGEDKDRDRDLRKDRDTPSAPEGLPARPEGSGRHRTQSGEDGLGKRRRGEDEVDRGSKRGSRKDGHREDRGRRGGEKDGHDRGRESDRRRRERDEGIEAENRSSHPSDKNDRHSAADPPTPTSVKGPPPSAPRAMASSEQPLRPTKPEPSSIRDNTRDRHVTNGPTPTSSQTDGGTHSLQSRITAARTPPSGPQQSYRDDDRDYRKRTASDREQESNSHSAPGSGLPGGDLLSQPPKRPRLHRDRYGSKTQHGNSGLARRTLPLDEDKARNRRG